MKKPSGMLQRLEALERSIGTIDTESAYRFLEDLSEEETEAALNAPGTLERFAAAPLEASRASNAQLYGALYMALAPAAERLRAERGRIGKPSGPFAVGRFDRFRRVGPRDWVLGDGENGLTYGD